MYEKAAAEGIKRLKYGHALGFADFFGHFLAKQFEGYGRKSDIVVPVPLSWERRVNRGYNQSEWIAKAYCRETGLTLCSNALFKIRDTVSQVELTHEERRRNLEGSFLAEPVFVRGKKVLLVDDVMTTGSTFEVCTAALLEAGAKQVDCLSAATSHL